MSNKITEQNYDFPRQYRDNTKNDGIYLSPVWSSSVPRRASEGFGCIPS